MPRHLRPVLLFAVLITGTGCRVERNPEPTTTDPGSHARQQIDGARMTYQGALLAGDARAATSHFTVDAHLSDPVFGHVESAGQVYDRLRGFFAADGSIIDVGLDPETVELSGGTAYEFGEYRETRRGTVEHLLSGRYVIKWRRGAEANWRIERMLISAAPSVSAADNPDAR